MKAPAKRTVALVVADDDRPVPTPQEAFNHIVRATRADGYARSEDDNGDCLYRGPDGDRCLAGKILPDREYNPELEGQPVEDLAGTAGGPFAGWGKPADVRSPLWVLVQMQSCHDEIDPALWEQEFQRIAIEAGLDYQAP